ncbi:Zinc finger mynd domain-containing protein 12 [Plakobranchus ocellatus]|uniref:alanine--glyoxylate transaminase n=1 Tax=Plakobranchus ocellatus TaxID=259542 RepID=A0AAV4ANQ9_9GAST|nr:Zinc finger mynd domain-containing protein 12 [Plakobranchus ocellatus]
MARPLCATILGRCLQCNYTPVQVVSPLISRLNASSAPSALSCIGLEKTQKMAFSSSARSNTNSQVSEPPACLLKPLEVPNKLLMGPGPSNPPPRVLAAGALPLLGHMHPEFFEVLDDVKAGIQYVFQTKNEWTYAISGSGHAAMEAAVVNLLEIGDVALVCQNGIWGGRIAEMVDRNGSIVKKLVRPMGEVFSLEEIEQGLKEHKPKLVFVTYGESSSGSAQPLEGLGDLCRKYDALLLVDSVAIAGGAPLFMDAWNIDVLYSGSQKVMGAPPATSPISFNQRARDVIANRKTKVRSYYLDAAELANYWGCDENPRRYHHTCLVSSIYALREGLARLAEQGLEKSWQEHRKCAEMLYEGLEKMGLEMWIKDKAIRNPCVTTIRVPEGVEWKKVVDHLMKQHKIEIAGALGKDLLGEIWRIGIMGHNCTPENVNRTLQALKEALDLYWKK